MLMSDILLESINSATDDILEITATYLKDEINGWDIEEMVYNWMQADYQFIKKAANEGIPTTYPEFKIWLNKAFNAKFGMSLKDYYNTEEKNSTNSFNSISSDIEKKIYKALSTYMTVKVTPKYMKEIRFYVTGKKVNVFVHDNFGIPAVLLNPESFGMTITQMTDWLSKQGAKQIKRPSKKKNYTSYSYYD